MPRPIWKGSISFGLVNVPINLYPAEERKELALHMIDSRDMSRVKFQRVSAESGKEVSWDQIVKGYEHHSGEYVILDDKELERAAPEATRTVAIEAFVEGSQIDPVSYDKPYYIEPAKGGEKGYVLLREALKESGRVGIARVVIRTRQYLAALIPRGDVLVLDLLRYANEVRSADGLNIPVGPAKNFGVTPQELKIARMLVDSMATEWKPEKFHDEYHDELMKYIEKKVESGKTHQPMELPPAEKEHEGRGPYNFMELLKKSVEQTSGGRGANGRAAEGRGAGREAGSRGGARQTRKPAARRAPARRKVG